MGLFEIRGRSDNDPGTRYFIGNVEVKSGKRVPCYIWVRRIPGNVIERIERDIPGKVVRTKFGGAPFRKRSEAEQTQLLYKKYAWALTKIEGPIATPVDEEAAQLFKEALGRPVQKGKPINLNGELNDETKVLLLREIPTLAGIVAEKLAELNHLYDEEEDAETRNLSTGSSGESPPTSRE